MSLVSLSNNNVSTCPRQKRDAYSLRPDVVDDNTLHIIYILLVQGLSFARSFPPYVIPGPAADAGDLNDSTFKCILTFYREFTRALWVRLYRQDSSAAVFRYEYPVGGEVDSSVQARSVAQPIPRSCDETQVDVSDYYSDRNYVVV